MRLYYLIGSLLLVAGCQDTSNHKTNVDSSDTTIQNGLCHGVYEHHRLKLPQYWFELKNLKLYLSYFAPR